MQPPDPNDARVARVLKLSVRAGTSVSEELVGLYSEWAGDPSAVPARRLALNALLSESSLSLRLKNVLDAVQADPTPPEEDPLWPYITEQLATVWNDSNFDKGRDLMLMEKRPRAQRALVASWMQFSKMRNITDEQRLKLSADFVDIYASTDPSQRPELEETLRNLAGNDIAEIVSGRALEEGAKLEAEVAAEEMIEEGKRLLLSHGKDDGNDPKGRELPPELMDEPDEPVE